MPIQPSGFFVLRTPLLSFDEALAWTDGSSDRDTLRKRLLETWQRPEVREAVFLASPDLDAALARSAESATPDKQLLSLSAYFARMTSRATPFGLFAGSSVGTIAERTQLDLAPRCTYRRHTRLDMDYLARLVHGLEQDPVVRQRLQYQPNNSLYRAGARLHYAEARQHAGGRSYHLVALQETPEVAATLERATQGATLAELAAALTDNEVSLVEAHAFVQELAESQVLVADLGPAVTGSEPVHGLIARLSVHADTRHLAASLEEVRHGLRNLDHAGVGQTAPERYAQLQAGLDPLPARAELSRLFQVDMFKPAAHLSLGRNVTTEIERGLGILQRFSSGTPGGRAFREFVDRFVARYEEAEVALVEALDEEVGIGFGAASEPGGEPLLEGLDQPARPPEDATWDARDDLRLRLLANALSRGEQAVELTSAHLEALSLDDAAPPPPDAFAVFARLGAASADAVDRGEFRVLVQSASGPSGARLLGRFCDADPELHARVLEHLRAEEANRPDAISAEIVHLPEGRLGNILMRPVLRDYEIPFLGQSGAEPERQLPLSDLRVAVCGGRVVLRSARLNREVIPRMSTAHNFAARGLGAYRFLCALQHQGVTPVFGWTWGPLERSPFLPRVTSGRLVLSRASWNLTAAELRPALAARGAEQFAAVQNLRASRRLPRFVALADFDNELLVDLDNMLSIESFLHQVKDRDVVRLVELFPTPDEMCVVGPEGHFVAELIIPFVKSAEPLVTSLPVQASTCVRRRFPPGSEWLYAKIYTGPAVADRVLVDGIASVVQAALDSGSVDQWFFIRYLDRSHTCDCGCTATRRN